MPQSTYLERGLSVLEARLQGPQNAQSLVPVPGGQPFVTLGRETGAGATTVGHLLVPLLDQAFGAEGQGWVFLDKNLLAHALARVNLPQRLADHLPEDKVSEIKAVIGELLGLHPSLWDVEQRVAEAILQLANIGRVIIAGRAAYLITQALPGGFHVKLVAPLAVRVQRVMKLMNCSEAAAAAHVRKTDLGRRRYVRTRFGRNIDDVQLFDLVINTERMLPETVAQIIVQAMRGRQAPSSADVREQRSPTLVAAGSH